MVALKSRTGGSNGAGILIFISEDKTIDIRFNHAEELSLLEAMVKADKTELNNSVSKKIISTNRKSKGILSIVNKSLVSAESEVCYG